MVGRARNPRIGVGCSHFFLPILAFARITGPGSQILGNRWTKKRRLLEGGVRRSGIGVTIGLPRVVVICTLTLSQGLGRVLSLLLTWLTSALWMRADRPISPVCSQLEVHPS